MQTVSTIGLDIAKSVFQNDVTDAEAICEAVTRPNMRFVATKTPEQQSCLTLHRTRHLFIRQQTPTYPGINWENPGVGGLTKAT